MDNKIPQTTKDRWLPALESGELPQARQALYDGLGYCCLGILARACGASFHTEILDEGGEDERESDYIVDVDGHDINEGELLDQQWADQQGISADAQKLLSMLNDGGEHTTKHDNPLIEVWRKHAMAERPSTVQDATVFTMPKCDFATIAKVIREDL